MPAKYIQPNLPIAATQRKQKQWLLLTGSRYSQGIFSGGGGGDFEWLHEAGDRYWKGATKTGLTVYVSNLVNLDHWIPLLCLAFNLIFKQDFNGNHFIFTICTYLHLFLVIRGSWVRIPLSADALRQGTLSTIVSLCSKWVLGRNYSFKCTVHL